MLRTRMRMIIGALALLVVAPWGPARVHSGGRGVGRFPTRRDLSPG